MARPYAKADSGRRFDEYGALPLDKENERLDNLAAQLREEPQSKGYVVMYEGSEDSVRDLKTRGCRALQRLLKHGGVNPKNVVAMLIVGGHRKNFTVELWMWPVSARDDLPRFGLEINEHEVSIIKGTQTATKCCRKRH